MVFKIAHRVPSPPWRMHCMKPVPKQFKIEKLEDRVAPCGCGHLIFTPPVCTSYCVPHCSPCDFGHGWGGGFNHCGGFGGYGHCGGGFGGFGHCGGGDFGGFGHCGGFCHFGGHGFCFGHFVGILA